MIRTPAAAGLMALMMGFTAVAAPAPALAGGRVSFTVTPQGDDARLISEGLRVYSWARDQRRNRAKVDQRGTGNGAAIGQSGSGNSAGIYQRGSGHSASISQTGNNNAFGIFQFGRNTRAEAVQSGNGQSGFVFIGGW